MMKRAGSVVLLLGCLSAGLASCQYLPKSLDLSAKSTAPAKAPERPVAVTTTKATTISTPVSIVPMIDAGQSRVAGLEADNARLKNELATALRENTRLKKDLAESMDDNALLKDLAAKRQR